MSEQQNNNAWIDVAISCLVIVIVLFSAWNTIQIQQVKTIAEYNKEHVCFLTDVIYGPVPPATMEEMCDALREDLHKEWQVQSR